MDGVTNGEDPTKVNEIIVKFSSLSLSSVRRVIVAGRYLTQLVGRLRFPTRLTFQSGCKGGDGGGEGETSISRPPFSFHLQMPRS